LRLLRASLQVPTSFSPPEPCVVRDDGVRFGDGRATAVKAGALNVTLTNYRNTDAPDGVLGAANTLLCPRCLPGLLEILDFPARF
jgi:hypothetical protein